MLYFIILVALLCAPSSASTNKKADKVSGTKAGSKLVKGKILHIKQANFGRWKAYFANGKAAVKPGVVSGLHSPPYKKVYFVNPENKTYMVWDTRKPYLMSNIYRSPVTRCSKFKFKGTKRIHGLNCRQVNGLDRLGNVRVRFYFTKALDAPISWRKGLSQTMSYPESFGVPMKIAVKQRIGSQLMWTVPYNVEKIEDTTFSANIFDLPPNYKKVDSITALVFSSDGNLDKSDIEDLFEHHFKDKKKASKKK